MRKPKVLFLCTGNRARSQMAEALLKHHAGDRFEIYSAGLEPEEIHPMTIQVMEEAGFDMSDHEPKGLGQFLGTTHFGYLITVCRNAEEKCPTFPGVGSRIFWPIEDPVAFEGPEEERLEKFRAARDELERRILAWLEEFDDKIPIKVFGTTPPCANCERAERHARRAAEQFPDQVEVIKLDALGPEGEEYGIMTTPLVVVGDEVVGRGRIVPAAKLVSIIEQKLGGK